MNMAEDNPNDMSADMFDADMSVPPIDNIHAPKPELDLPQLPDTPQQPTRPQMPLQTGEQLDTEMAGVTVKTTLLINQCNAC